MTYVFDEILDLISEKKTLKSAINIKPLELQMKWVKVQMSSYMAKYVSRQKKISEIDMLHARMKVS